MRINDSLRRLAGARPTVRVFATMLLAAVCACGQLRAQSPPPLALPEAPLLSGGTVTHSVVHTAVVMPTLIGLE